MAHEPANPYETPAHPAPGPHHAGPILSPAHDEAHPNVGHLVSPKILFATAGALLVLTIVTVAAAKVDFAHYDLEELNIWVALIIAGIKASLVCLFFMHLRWDRPFNAFVLATSLAFVVLFISFAMTDSTEYHDDIIPGDSKKAMEKLSQLPALQQHAGEPATEVK